MRRSKDVSSLSRGASRLLRRGGLRLVQGGLPALAEESASTHTSRMPARATSATRAADTLTAIPARTNPDQSLTTSPNREATPFVQEAANKLWLQGTGFCRAQYHRLAHWLDAQAMALLICGSALTVILAGAVIYWELKTSSIVATYISGLAPRLSYQLKDGANSDLHFPVAGPYDIRLGYTNIPAFTNRLAKNGWEVTAQARLSPLQRRLTDWGLNAPYQEKTAHGLTVLDADGRTLFANQFPREAYKSFASIPHLVVTSLLFIEDRQVLNDESQPTLNPAISWDRLTKASLELALDRLGGDRNVPGGSTLATQIEKFRHSPQGRTHGAIDKLQQMASASVRAYLLGRDTRPAREDIVINYINSVPLGAVPGIGEVSGLGDGLRAWYGVSLEQINQTLASQPGPNDLQGRADYALAFKRVLALFLSQRRPAYYLQQNQADLEELANRYIRLMAGSGIIAKRLALDALVQPLGFLPKDADRSAEHEASFVERKAINAVRFELMQRLGTPSLYVLDRLDLEVASTFDRNTQNDVTDFLIQLKTPEGASKAGLIGERLLSPAQAPKVNYSFTLLERVDDHNVVRVQADTLESPLDINHGGKLELGSTAKLRTLITYLDLVGELYEKFAPHVTDRLWLEQALARTAADDALSQWVLTWLREHGKSSSLPAILDAAMLRQVSASPYSSFRTGGGLMRFSNFDPSDNDRQLSVASAFQKSNNLVFVRVMKDIVDHVIATRIPYASEMLKSPHHSMRRVYLDRYIEWESSAYLRRFWREFRDLTADIRFERLKAARKLTTTRLASLLLSLNPNITFEEFKSAMNAEPGLPTLDDNVLQRYWNSMHPSVMSLRDRAFVARVHPLELWLVAHLSTTPNAIWRDTFAASQTARFESYAWLTQRHGTSRQDRYIRTMLEREAFGKHIVNYWKRQGFPFDYMAPSLASALGSSGDRPAALAELMGAIYNHGVMMPTRRVEEIRFGRATPYETVVEPWRVGATRVTTPEIAQVVQKALQSVVAGGSAVRLDGALKRSDGSKVSIAAKTGTGDNRMETYGRNGQVLHSEAKSRTATLVFAIGERFHGTITAYVKADELPTDAKDATTASNSSAEVEDFRFTSALVAQALRALMPSLEPAILPVEDPWAFAIQ